MPAITKSGNVLTKELTKPEQTNSVSIEYIVNPTYLLEKIKQVDGEGSGLDADLVRGSYINPRMFKNRIINGDFSVWQRGTSASYISDAGSLTSDSGYKTADRIECLNSAAGGQFTVTKSEMNGVNSFKVTVDIPPDDLTWDGEHVRWWRPFRYVFEGQHLYDLVQKKAKITISFLFRSNVLGNFSVALKNLSGGQGEDTYDTYVTTFDYSGDESIQKVVITIPLDYNFTSTPKNDNNTGFELCIGVIADCYTTTILNQWQSGTSGNAVGASFCPLCASGYTNWGSQVGNYLEIAQIQLEEGDVATEFEYIPYEIQLMRCLRYYWRVNGNITLTNGYWYDGTHAWYHLKLPVSMRATPSLEYSSLSDLILTRQGAPASGSTTEISLSMSNNDIIRLTAGIDTDNNCTGEGSQLDISESGWIAFDAELY